MCACAYERASAYAHSALPPFNCNLAGRAKYDPDEYRRDALQQLRRHLHEVLLDQLPVLKSLQRLLDEMALVGADSGPHAERMFGSDQGAGGRGGRAARLILEQVPAVREALVRGRNWPALAAQLRDTWLGEAAAQLARERAERMLKSFEFLCSLEEAAAPQQEQLRAAGTASAQGTVAASSTSGGGDGVVRVECWRRVRAGVHERWCEFDCQLDSSRVPEAVVVKGDSGGEAAGTRHRLVPIDLEATRALPCDGKVGCRAVLATCNNAPRGCACAGSSALYRPPARDTAT